MSPPPVRGLMRSGRGWPRVAGLLGVTFATSVVQPGVLISVPFLLLVFLGGVRRTALVIAAAVAVLWIFQGPRDGLWYVERAWALLVGGWFVGFSMALPEWRLSGRALASSLASLAAAALVLISSRGAWSTLDFAVADAVRGGVATAVDAMTLVRGGEALSPGFVSALYQTAEAQAEVFPAMLGIASMAALSVAWWLYTRLTGGGDQAVGPVRNFRFNDHLVWLLIGGLLLLLAQWGEGFARVGSNAVVFMGALYALRGAAVVMFISGGLTLFGYVMLAIGLLLAAPVVVGLAMMVGIGDTWVDVRARMRATET